MQIINVVLILVLAIAGLTKLRDLSQFRQALIDFGFKREAARPLTSLTPALELLLAVLLIFPETRLLAAGVLTFLLLCFTWLLARVLATNRKVICACFGSASTEPVTTAAIFRNLLLIGLSTTNFFYVSDSLVPGVGSLEIVWLRGALAAGVVSVGTFLTLWWAYSPLRTRGSQEIKVGRMMPPIILFGSDGAPLIFPSPVKEFDVPRLRMIVVSPGCTGCRQLLDEMVGSSRTFDDVIVAYVIESPRIPAWSPDSPWKNTAMIPADADKLRITIYPSIVTVNNDFTISGIEAGVPAISAVLQI